METLAADQQLARTWYPRVARVLPVVARLVLGLVFFVFGLGALLNLFPPPSTPIPEGALAFSIALMKTGYLFQLLKGTEVLAGMLLLANRFVPLALALLAPVIVNIFAFHLFLEPSGLALAVVLAVVEIYLAWRYRDAYRAILTPRLAGLAGEPRGPLEGFSGQNLLFVVPMEIRREAIATADQM